jgi:ribosome-associated protein
MTNTQTTPPEPSPQLPESIEQIVDAARDKKAENVLVLDLRPANAFTDHLVICSGRSRRQVISI